MQIDSELISPTETHQEIINKRQLDALAIAERGTTALLVISTLSFTLTFGSQTESMEFVRNSFQNLANFSGLGAIIMGLRQVQMTNRLSLIHNDTLANSIQQPAQQTLPLESQTH